MVLALHKTEKARGEESSQGPRHAQCSARNALKPSQALVSNEQTLEVDCGTFG